MERWKTLRNLPGHERVVCYLITRHEKGYRVLESIVDTGVSEPIHVMRKKKKKSPRSHNKEEHERPKRQKVLKPILPDTDQGFLVDDFQGKRLWVTDHAVRRLVDRWPDYWRLPVKGDVQKSMRVLLRNAKLAPVGTVLHAVERIIIHGFKETEYWYARGCLCFVVVMGQGGISTLVTVEPRSLFTK